MLDALLPKIVIAHFAFGVISMSDLNPLLFIAAEKDVFPLDLGLEPLNGRSHAVFHVACGEEQGEGQERRLQQVSKFYLPRSCEPRKIAQ